MHAFSHSILSRFANVEKNIIRQALKPVDKRCHLKTLGLLMECKMATAGHSTNLLGRHFGIHWNRVYRYIRSSIDLRLYFSLLRSIEQSLANRLLNLAPRRTLVRPEIYSRVRNILRISIWIYIWNTKSSSRVGKMFAKMFHPEKSAILGTRQRDAFARNSRGNGCLRF